MPLKYFIRDNIHTRIRNFVQLLDDYVEHAPLSGETFDTDAAEVHTYIVNFITENQTDDNKILPFMAQNGRSVDYQALKYYYKGVSENSRTVLKSEDDIQ